MAVISFVLSILFISPILSYVLIETSLGPIRGTTMLSRNGKTFYSFLGLPFAEPPIGDLRFQNPIPFTKAWNFTYDATKQPEICAQSGINWAFRGSEDCLYLNLYTPQLPNKNAKKLPIWFFIYPGRRLFGDPTTPRWGPQYIMDEPVIFVSASYRVGAFGFLSMEDDVIPGNFGLKDQVAALLWIQRYISDFGGDPNRVTISGESSGAVDVAMHLFSPTAKPLFHRAILQSGFCLNYRAIASPGKGREQAWKLARITGCKNKYVKTSEDLLECLRMTPVETITSNLIYMMHDFVLPHTFFGVVIEKPGSDQAYLVSHPFEELHKPSNKTLLLGMNTDEAHQKAIGIYAFPTKDLKLKKYIRDYICDNYQRILPKLLGFEHLSNSVQLLELIRAKYFPDKRLQDAFQELAKAYGISTVQLGMIEAALHYQGPRYFYHYDHLNKISYRRMYDIVFGLYTKERMGVIHGEEFRSLFHQPILFPPVLTGDDRVVSNQVVKMWSNFVIYGNPNGIDEQIWQPVSSSQLEYLHFHNLTYAMKSEPFWEDYLFWKKLGNPPLMTSEVFKNIFLANNKI